VTERGLSQRHACPLVGVQRSTARYVSHGRIDEAATVALIQEYAHEQPMYGYRIITPMLKHDGYSINRKRVYRTWRQEGLQLPRRKTVKRRYGDSTGTLRRAARPNEVWTYDFLEARTERGGKLRILTLLDEYTRECLSIHVARSISSRQVIQGLEWLFLLRGAPTHPHIVLLVLLKRGEDEASREHSYQHSRMHRLSPTRHESQQDDCSMNNKRGHDHTCHHHEECPHAVLPKFLIEPQK
jgi:hypothetical protein